MNQGQLSLLSGDAHTGLSAISLSGMERGHVQFGAAPDTTTTYQWKISCVTGAPVLAEFVPLKVFSTGSAYAEVTIAANAHFQIPDEAFGAKWLLLEFNAALGADYSQLYVSLSGPKG